MLEIELILFWGEPLDVLEDVLLWVREGNQEVLALLGRQQLHKTLKLMGTNVFCH